VRELAAALIEMGKGTPAGQTSVEELILAGVRRWNALARHTACYPPPLSMMQGQLSMS
jgi:hypothetical protein